MVQETIQGIVALEKRVKEIEREFEELISRRSIIHTEILDSFISRYFDFLPDEEKRKHRTSYAQSWRDIELRFRNKMKRPHLDLLETLASLRTRIESVSQDDPQAASTACEKAGGLLKKWEGLGTAAEREKQRIETFFLEQDEVLKNDLRALANRFGIHLPPNPFSKN